MKSELSRIVLSFDDGRKDNFDVAVPILQKYGFTATFNITTAYVDGTISAEGVPCENMAMTQDNVKELHKAGFEIACHGDCHKNDPDDIKTGLEKLREWLEWEDEYKPGFASPESNLTSVAINNYIDLYKSLFSYIRIASYTKETFSNRFIRKMAHISHSTKLYNKAFWADVGGIRDGFVASSIPIINMTTKEQVEILVRKIEKEKEDCILMFHSIVDKDDVYANDMWSWHMDKFEELCKWLHDEQSKGRLEIAKTISLI